MSKYIYIYYVVLIFMVFFQFIIIIIIIDNNYYYSYDLYLNPFKLAYGQWLSVPKLPKNFFFNCNQSILSP